MSPSGKKRKRTRSSERTKWSANTRQIVDDALKGLSVSAQQRFVAAVTALRADWQQQIAAEFRGALEDSWTDYLSRIVPTMLRRGQILQLHGMLILIGDYPAALDHERIARAVRQRLGTAGERRYREVIADFFGQIGVEPEGSPS